MEMPRETALLLALLTQLQRQWMPLAEASDIQSQLLSLGVSASPSVSFRTAVGETVDVRGLAIGDKLFVHFVARETAIRLDLLLSEYTKLDASGVDGRTHARVGQWTISTELLQWRLERNVFPMFSGGVEQSAHVATSAGAELGRLPEPLLLRIAPFLTGKDFCGMTQSNKFLHEYADATEIWRGYVENEFPRSGAAADEPAAKSLYVKLHERERRRAAAIRTVWESLPPPPPYLPSMPILDPFVRPPPLFGPTTLPPRRPEEPRPAFFDEMY